MASEGDLVYTTSRTTKPDVTSKMVKKAGTEVEDILIESEQAENSSSGVWGVLASSTRQEPGQLSFLYSEEAKVSDLQVGTKASTTLTSTSLSTKQTTRTPFSLSTSATSDTITIRECNHGRNIRERSPSTYRLALTSSLPNVRRQWWSHSSDEDDNGNDDDDDGNDTSDDESCNIITSSITLFYDPITSWSTLYLTSSIASEVVMPAQTIWADCQPGSTDGSTATSTNLSQPTAQAGQEVSQQVTWTGTSEYKGISMTTEGDSTWVASFSGSRK